MIILRNKTYSTTSQVSAPKYNPTGEETTENKGRDNSRSKLAGEVLGTAAIGTVGTLGAAGLAEKATKGVVSRVAGKKAKKEYRDFLKSQDYRRLKALEQIDAQKALEQAPYKKTLLGRIMGRSKIKDAEYVAEGKKSRLEGRLKRENLAKREDLIMKRNAKVSRAGRTAKRAAIVGGSLLMAKAITDKIKKGRKENDKG